LQQSPKFSLTKPDPETFCPLLYAQSDSGCEELTGPQEIKTGALDSGDDLTDGILAVDGARVLLNSVRREVKRIKYQNVRDRLLTLVDGWRAFLKRRLQYFVNMVLFPVVGYGKEKVSIHFDGCWLEPREFTVNVMPSEKRGYKHESSFFLKSLFEVVNEIADTLVTVKDFVEGLTYLKIDRTDNKLLRPLFKKVTDGI
jgi:hypothetical protein